MDYGRDSAEVCVSEVCVCVRNKNWNKTITNREKKKMERPKPEYIILFYKSSSSRYHVVQPRPPPPPGNNTSVCVCVYCHYFCLRVCSVYLEYGSWSRRAAAYLPAPILRAGLPAPTTSRRTVQNCSKCCQAIRHAV